MAKRDSRALLPVERRLYVHGALARVFLYVPILVEHMVSALSAAGFEHPNTAALSVLALFSVGVTLAEYPSGVLADWIGRAPTLVAGSLIHAGGTLLFLMPESLIWLGLGQLLIGVGAAFRSGSDSALLYSELDSAGEAHRYAGALARLRFFNVVGLTVAALAGGFLYEAWPSLVFGLTSVLALASALPLLGLREQHRAIERPDYTQVLRESLREARHNRRAQALVLMGGTGTAYFLFANWGTQTYLVSADVPPAIMGQTVAAISLLSAASMALAAWLGATRVRNRRTFPVLYGGLVVGIVAAGAAYARGAIAAGAVCMVAAAACHTLHRNMINVSLQGLVSDRVRASMNSLETWVGSLWYVVVFPVAGVLLDGFGIAGGHYWIGAGIAATLGPLLVLARLRGVWSARRSAAQETP